VNAASANEFYLENEKNANQLTLKTVWVYYIFGVIGLTVLDILGVGGADSELLPILYGMVLIPYVAATWAYYRFEGWWIKYALIFCGLFASVMTVVVSGRGEFLAALWFFPVLLCFLYNNQQLLGVFVAIANIGHLAVILSEPMEKLEVRETAGGMLSLIVVSATIFVINKRGIQVLNFVIDAEEKAHAIGDKLSGVLEKSRQNAVTVQEVGQKVADSAASINSSIEDIASTANELSANLQESTDQIDQISGSSKDVSERAKTGQENLEKLKESTNEITRAMEQIKESTEALLTQSEQIMKIVLQIRDIADQTNLLALNAAIEAARAGHSGRGFAVVADEVRKLSDQTAELVDQITSTVEEGAKLSTGARESINSGATAVENNARMINETSNELENVLANASSIAESTGEIAGNIREIMSSGENLASVTQEQSAATEELSTLAQNLLESSQQLKEELDTE